MTQKEEFIEAIENDEYCVWQLSENIYLETDNQFDGTFHSVAVRERRITNRTGN